MTKGKKGLSDYGLTSLKVNSRQVNLKTTEKIIAKLLIKKNIINIFFYSTLVAYVIYGTNHIYNYISYYKTLQEHPRTILNMYIMRGEWIFVRPIILSLIYNGILCWITVKTIELKKLKNYILFFLIVSISFLSYVKTFHSQTMLEYQANSIVNTLCIVQILFFTGSYAIQNQTIIFAWFLILISIIKNNKKSFSLFFAFLLLLGFIFSFLLFFRFIFLYNINTF